MEDDASGTYPLYIAGMRMGPSSGVIESKMIEEQEGVKDVAGLVGPNERSKRMPTPSMVVCGSMIWEMVLMLCISCRRCKGYRITLLPSLLLLPIIYYWVLCFQNWKYSTATHEILPDA